MPQLDSSGLSEVWLQKTCGERHWSGLAQALRRPPQSWFDAQGQRVYAAFGMVRLQGAELWRAREGQTLALSGTLHPIGRVQAWSRHRLEIAGRAIGQLEMLSMFVSRSDASTNRSVRRTAMDAGGDDPPPMAITFMEHAKTWRRALAEQTSPPSAVAPHGPEPLTFLPCPRADFNGAGLLYFPSFTGFADRALWAWGLLGVDDVVLARECLFVGNLDLGESLTVRLDDQCTTTGGRRVSLRLTSASDGRLLAAIRLHVRQRSA
jgi:probable biosynthetic protein (TIGR04099 family)